jgi:hypothetical protein
VCSSDLNHAYRVHGVYLDTVALDVFQRSPGYRRKKYRLRRYGADALVYLEQKRKSGNKVAKRRTGVPDAELERLIGDVEDVQWPGHWYARRVSMRQLKPACHISYERHAFIGHDSEGPLRLTLDRHLHCRLTERYEVLPVAGGLALLTGQVLMELKYRRALPTLFKSLIEDFALTPRPASKYRLTMQAWRGEASVREVG